MIGYIKGNLIDIDFTSGKVCVVVNNLGYLINVSAVLLSEYALQQEIELYCHPEVREDAFELFGFKSISEKLFFKKLRNVNGIGPKTALSLMNLSLNDLTQAIETKNVTVLTSVPGLGKKTAERLILELNGNLPDLDDSIKSTNKYSDNLVSALENFGYKKKDILKILETSPSEMTEEQDLIKYFLTEIRK